MLNIQDMVALPLKRLTVSILISNHLLAVMMYLRLLIVNARIQDIFNYKNQIKILHSILNWNGEVLDDRIY